MKTKGFRVRLDDGSEMDLDSDMLRSWYEQGLIRGDTPMRAPASRNWKRMDEVVELRDWKQADRSGDEREYEGELRPVGPQRWRSYVASLLLFLGAAGAGYWAFFPERWTSDLPPAPWREIALAELILGLCLVRGWGLARAFVRVVMLLAAFALFPLAGLLIAQGVRGLPLLVLLSAWVVASGFFAFLGSVMATSSAILCLVTILLGAAGIYYFGYVPVDASPRAPGSGRVWSPVPAAAPTRAPVAPAAGAQPTPVAAAAGAGRAVGPAGSASSAAPSPAPPAGRAQAVRAATEEVPLLSAQAAEALMSRSAAQILDPPEVFRRSYGLVGRGLWALSREESKEMGDLHTTIYASLPPAQRARLGDYIDRARSRYATTPEEDRQMSQVMKSAVLALPPDKRARLRSLFEKAMTAGLAQP